MPPSVFIKEKSESMGEVASHVEGTGWGWVSKVEGARRWGEEGRGMEGARDEEGMKVKERV